jgi:hypothetical protein
MKTPLVLPVYLAIRPLRAQTVNVSNAGLYGGPVLSVLGTVTVTVTNVGASSVCPAFRAFTVPERASTGTVIGTFTCTNTDAVTLTYSVSATGPNANRPFPFTMSSAGNIGTLLAAPSTTAGELDYEGTFRFYNASITVTTSSAQPLSTSASITIALSDIPERPYFVPGALVSVGVCVLLMHYAVHSE